MEVAHFYHAWCNGGWHDPVFEHRDALLESGFPSPVHLGVVGGPQERAKVAAAFGPGVKVVAQERHGWEQVTLMQLAAYAADHDGAVMYAHTKSDTAWRRLMTDRVVRNWQHLAGKLEDGYDVAGDSWRLGPGMDVGDARRHPALLRQLLDGDLRVHSHVARDPIHLSLGCGEVARSWQSSRLRHGHGHGRRSPKVASLAERC
ncbi:MAG TPA: hypothetical protein VGL79_00250 [Solirubrobacteraceae bacterium]|jgi:hypothetical protein